MTLMNEKYPRRAISVFLSLFQVSDLELHTGEFEFYTLKNSIFQNNVSWI